MPRTGTSRFSLLNLGAAVDARGFRNATSLMLAAARGDVQMTNLLLSRGADPTAEDDSRRTAADYAKKEGFVQLAMALANAPAPKAAAAPPRDPQEPFRVGWTYRVKQYYKSHDRWAQELKVGEELRYESAFDWEATGERKFIFRGEGSDRERAWVVVPGDASTWDQYFDELGKISR